MIKFICTILLCSTFLVLINCNFNNETDETFDKIQNETKSTPLHKENVGDASEKNEPSITVSSSPNVIVSNSIKTDNENSSNVTIEVPNMINNSSEIKIEKSQPSIILESPLKHDNATESSISKEDVPIKVDSTETTTTNADDIPTFVEYQQMIEKESKQKREKSDNIPNIPSMVVKDGAKGIIDVSSTHTNTEHPESSQSSSSKAQEAKDDIEASHISRKSDELKVEVTTSTLSKSLMKNNVAAKECGAKILEISNQISHAGFVLNNNKDEYLNVPCSIPDKWFIIETCEPVQIRSIQIANFEMFSSRPKTFKVSTADRYPVKHWYNLGMFRAHDEKGLQTFEVSDTRMVKYLKFEMVDHYGNEHYCPLTFVRVMGNVVIDDMDEESDEDQPAIPEKNEVPKEFPSTSDSNGILTKAKDMIVKIVNGIGGSNKQNNMETPQIDSEPIGEETTQSEALSISESPCYFFEFISRNFHKYFQDILVHFERINHLRGPLLTSDMANFHLNIINQPSPFQIRAEYFSLLTWLSNTDYSFLRLYLSYLNVSSHCSPECLEMNSLRNLSDLFRCKIYQYPSFDHYLPLLPNITFNFKNQEESLGDSSSNLESNSVVAKEIVVSNTSASLPPRIFPSILSAPPLPIEVDSATSSSQSSVGNDSTIEDVQLPNKTKAEEDFSDLSKDSKVSSTNEQPNSESLKSAQSKYKSDEVFDNKIFASPGSNAWNYAFMRIKNIAKELEVNVSISMKYLEELSQNYKQQTDKLKKAQIVMAANVTKLENMINQHRQETRTFIKDLKLQLQAIIIKMRFGFSSEIGKQRSTKSLNLSTMQKDNEHDCIDILSDELTLISPSWFDSSAFCIGLNVSLSLLCNSILLAVFYNKMKTNILNEVAKGTLTLPTQNCKKDINANESNEEIPLTPSHMFSPFSPQRQMMSYPVVLPPRGVHISNFPDCDYFSDDDNLPRRHRGLGPYFYPVQPNVNFVTPTKDKKKKKKK